MTGVQVIRRRAPSEPVHLLDVEVTRGDRTRVSGALWDGVLTITRTVARSAEFEASPLVNGAPTAIALPDFRG